MTKRDLSDFFSDMEELHVHVLQGIHGYIINNNYIQNGWVCVRFFGHILAIQVDCLIDCATCILSPKKFASQI